MSMKRIEFICIYIMAILICSFMSSPSIAGEENRNNIRSKIILDFTQEEWVKASTVRVVVNISALSKEQNLIRIKQEALSGLKKIINSEWIVTDYRRSKDRSGLTRLNIRAETRVPEGKLSGIYGRVKMVSREGLQINITSLDYSPTLDEIETAKARARARIYKMAVKEAKKLKEVMKIDFNIFQIDFSEETHGFIKRQMKAPVMMEKATMPSQLISVPRNMKIVVNARVILIQ